MRGSLHVVGAVRGAAVEVRRIVRPFRNLALGILVLVLFPLMVLLTAVAIFAMVGIAGMFLLPMGLVAIVALPAAAVLWMLLMVPSLVIRGDFRWPCQVAQAVLSPVVRAADWANTSDEVDRVVDGPMGAVDALWEGYGRLARRVEGC